ncbi:CsbD family protein [Kribbella sp. NPDC059898]|uniref:CsbD family protein n=1 Tax=Kribbella sp. NPDC059898 TaxID=3346995 RepID=UPI003659D42A
MGVGRKAKHAVKGAKGKVKKVTGKATGNRDLEAEGRTEQTKADLKQVGEKAKDAFKE